MEFQCFCCHVMCLFAAWLDCVHPSHFRRSEASCKASTSPKHCSIHGCSMQWDNSDGPVLTCQVSTGFARSSEGTCRRQLVAASFCQLYAILRRTHETIWNRRLAAASTMSSLGHCVYLLYLPRRGYKRRTRPFRVTLHRLCVTACIAQKRVAGSSSGCWIVAWLHPLCLSLFSLIHWIFAVGYEISKRCCERWLLRPLFLASIGLSFLEVFLRMPCIDSVVSSFPVPLCMFEGSRSQACSGPLVQPKDHSQSEASYRQLNHVEPLGLNDVLSSTQCCNPLP